MEDGNEILTEDDIVKAISFNGGIYGTTAVLVDVENLFGKTTWKKNRSKIITVARETHELFWQKYLVEVAKSSTVSFPEIIPLTKLQKYANNDLFVNVFPELGQSSQNSGWRKDKTKNNQ